MIFTLTGPSGSGKTSLVNKLMKKYPNHVKKIVTTTSRSPRCGETNGVDYHFLSREEFEHAVADGKFIEHVEFGGNLYGLQRADVEEALTSSDICILIIEQQGRKTLKAMYGDKVHCIYMAISKNKAMRRLYRRDGWKKAKARIMADKDNGLYDDSGYDCVLSRELTPSEHASRFMDFVEFCKEN